MSLEPCFLHFLQRNGYSNLVPAHRHGWGCTPDHEKAITYLSAAASNSASIEAEALEAGLKKGGAAKGELVLAIFELGNCFRNGWGVKKDPAAARQYFETAANLGDADAMNEVAWCYFEGFGGKKDKASGLLRSFPVRNAVDSVIVSPLGHQCLDCRFTLLASSNTYLARQSCL